MKYLGFLSVILTLVALGFLLFEIYSGAVLFAILSTVCLLYIVFSIKK